MKKLISCITAVILMLACAMPIFAADENSPIINVYKYNGSQYEKLTGDVQNGDYLMIKVGFKSAVPSVASLRVRLEFPQESLSYIEGSATGEIVSGNAQAGNPLTSVKNGAAIMYFSTNSTDGNVEIASNVTDISSFVFVCNAVKGSIKLRAVIDNAMDKDYKDIKLAKGSAEATVNVSSWKLSDSDLKIFQNLVNMQISGSVTLETLYDRITAADKRYGEFTAVEQAQFAIVYPDLMKAYGNAWTVYYDLAAAADRKQIEDVANSFKKTYSEVWGISGPDKIDENNYKSVISASTAFDKLDSKAKALLKKEKAIIDSLIDAAKQMKDKLEAIEIANSCAQLEFIEPFQNNLWCKSEEVVKSAYSDYQGLIAQAQAAYDGLDYKNLTGDTKTTVDKLYEKLKALTAAVKSAAAAAGEESSIMDEISAFTKNWYAVIKLNSLTVGLGDETAIKMMMSAYENLSDIAKERLSVQYKGAAQLLEMIKSMKSSSGQNITPVQAPQGGTTTQIKTVIETKQVEVPVEVEKLKSITDTNKEIQRMPQILKILSVIMCIAVASMAVPSYFLVRQMKKTDTQGENEDEEI